MRQWIGRFLRRRVYGHRRYAPLFRQMHRYAIAGLYGHGRTFEETGEVAVLDRLVGQLGAEPVIVDVGANEGAYARVVLARFPQVTLHCFEPHPGTFALLREALGDDSRARVHPFALGDTSGPGTIYSSGVSGDSCASLYADRGGGTVAEAVEVRRLDDIAQELGITHIDFLKIDAEGHDLAVLRGSGAFLESARAIQFEFGDANISSRTFIRDFYELLEPRFELFHVLEDGILPLGPYHELLEVFVGTNYLALRRDPP